MRMACVCPHVAHKVVIPGILCMISMNVHTIFNLMSPYFLVIPNTETIFQFIFILCPVAAKKQGA